jgi:hypothetical protein
MFDDRASSAETQGFPDQKSDVVPAIREPAVAGATGAERRKEQSAAVPDDGPAPDWVTADLDVLIPEAPASTSLDRNGQTGTSRPPWTKKQKRIYHRVNSVLVHWESQKFQIRWVMLSSSAESEAARLAQHHKELVRRVGRTLGFRDVHWFYVITREGFGVIHAFWAWRPGAGERRRVFWVPQSWLSQQWRTIHKADVVWISSYQNGGRSRRRVSRYVTTQYVADQAGLVRMGWSWGRTFGIPLAHCWRDFKKMHRRVPATGGMKWLIPNWESVMRGEALDINGGAYSLDSLREMRQWRQNQLGPRALEGGVSGDTEIAPPSLKSPL